MLSKLASMWGPGNSHLGVSYIQRWYGCLAFGRWCDGIKICGQRQGGTMICNALMTREGQRRRPIALTLNLDFVWPAWKCPRRQYVLLACPRKNNLSIGAWSDWNAETISFFVCVHAVVSVCVSSVSSEISSMKGVLFLPFIARSKNALLSCSLILARCTTSMSNADIQRSLKAHWLEERYIEDPLQSVMARIMVNLWSS